MRPIPCNICQRDDAKLFLSAFDQKTRDPTHRLRLVKCRHCGLVYLSPRPSEDIALAYFNEVYTGERNYAYYHDQEQIGKKARRRLEWLGDTVATDGKLLDVGAGKGGFVSAARKRGWDATGVELDADAVEKASQEFGVQLHHGRLDENTFAQQTFDVVAMWDVIEHVEDPVRLMRTAHRILRSGGHIILRTANIESRDFARTKRSWSMLFSGHLYYFSVDTIRRALAEVGFTQIAICNAMTIDHPSKPNHSDGKKRRSVRSKLVSLLRQPHKLVNLPSRVFSEYTQGGNRSDGFDVSIMAVHAVKEETAARLGGQL